MGRESNQGADKAPVPFDFHHVQTGRLLEMIAALKVITYPPGATVQELIQEADSEALHRLLPRS